MAEFPWLFVVELFLLGSVGGLLAGLLGVGGGMILVPFTTLLFAGRGIDAAITLKMALATSLATICFTAISSVRAHAKRGAVRREIVLALAPGIVVGGLIGAQLVRWMPAALLHIAFAVFIGGAATQMLMPPPQAKATSLPSGPVTTAVGGGIGLVSALVGAGGAFLSVPFMVWRGVPMHHAVGTASAVGLPIALAGTAGYVFAGWGDTRLPAAALGYVYLPALAALALASVLTAPLGAALAHRLNVKQLRRLFAFLLYGVSALMLVRGLRM